MVIYFNVNKHKQEISEKDSRVQKIIPRMGKWDFMKQKKLLIHSLIHF